MITIEEDIIKGLVAGGTVIGLLLKVALDMVSKKDKSQSAGDLSPAEWEARIFNIVRSASTNTQEVQEAINTLRLLADSLERNIDRLVDRRDHLDGR